MRLTTLFALATLFAVGGCTRPAPPTSEPQRTLVLAVSVEQQTVPPLSTTTIRAEQPGPQPTQAQPAPDDDYPTVERVRRITPRPGCGSMRFEGEPTAFELTVARWGVRAFPIYEAILADAASDPWDVAGVCDAINLVKDERRHFIPLLVHRLTTPDSLVRPGLTTAWDVKDLNERRAPFYRQMVRGSAIWLLGEIGSERDTEHIRPFLADKDDHIRRAVLQAFVKIGGPRDLDAINLWLCNPPRINEVFIQKVRKARDDLDARLRAAHAVQKL